MTLPTTLVDKENNKFVSTGPGPLDYAVKVTNPDGTPISGGGGGVSLTLKQQILNANDLEVVSAYTLVGTKYRLDSKTYSAASVSVQTILREYTWADFGNKNERITDEVYSIV